MMKTIAWLAIFSILAPALPGQTLKKGNWNQVAMLDVGQKLEIYPHSGDPVRGKFQSTTPENISILAGSRNLTTARSEVRVLKVRRKAGRLRNAWIGAAIGGGILGGITLAAVGGDLGGLGAAVVGVLGGLGAFVGFVVGMIPAAYTTLYEVERK
ncbi:MAG: hypothetical protein WKF37_21900 [Bryobacteraceae bacterium]